jgi:hypothetical protein
MHSFDGGLDVQEPLRIGCIARGCADASCTPSSCPGSLGRRPDSDRRCLATKAAIRLCAARSLGVAKSRPAWRSRNCDRRGLAVAARRTLIRSRAARHSRRASARADDPLTGQCDRAMSPALPRNMRRVRRRAKEPPAYYFAAARNAGLTPPSTPVVIGAVGTPRLMRSAISTSSRRCFSRIAAAISSGTE